MLRILGKTVSQVRRRRGLTQIELAQRAGVGLATIQNIESERANPSLETLLAIFKVLRIQIQLDAEASSIDWPTLSALGCPIMNDRASNQSPSVNRLLEEIGTLNPEEFKPREAKAVAAWLAAIRDHYPSVWRRIPYGIRAWSQNQDFSHKLRRTALERLADYL